MGSHFENVGGSLYKHRIDKEGKDMGDNLEMSKNEEEEGAAGAGDHHHDGVELDTTRLLKAFADKEGCHLKGYILINKVPGNFHISSHAYAHQIGYVARQAGINALDLSHKINHLSFGSIDDLEKI